ncbi:GNAT family N-acetyltransferase [Micromonospora sp. WMMD812]|uniref:GNAT family N-acetyltransferase n=1 Tax=Micromonospora sp. WMMD812 TaxID=3015152 RepID=UPI00248B21CE|nr:GNAT family N-acetyltransferase [Micromonospora sp. WMMD812]WBB70725.1 GNAT family N-acetyltransferase [Micromonospora sp. WMMD812]
MWIVTSRMSDVARWARAVADGPVENCGWPAEYLHQARQIPLGPIADPLDSEQPLLPVDPNYLFFAGIDRLTRHLVAGLTVASSNGVSEVGGAVHRDYRAQGYGNEMLDMVCALVHRHFGIARLVAGCEATNVASQRWLAKSGFVPASGPPTHTLPNGRVIQALWWDRVDHDPELRCRRPRPRPRRRLFNRR